MPGGLIIQNFVEVTFVVGVAGGKTRMMVERFPPPQILLPATGKVDLEPPPLWGQQGTRLTPNPPPL